MLSARLFFARRRERAALRHLVRRANAARDERRFADAATLYGEALALAPARADLHVQHGHMLKEDGAIAAAERAYLRALALLPDDADLALQLGHFFKVADRPEEAADAFRRTLALRPDQPEARAELDRLEEARSRAAVPAPAPDDEAFTAAELARLAPELAPGAVSPAEPRPGLDVRRCGRPEPGPWGTLRTLRGVEAIRGVCLSPRPVVAVEILLDDAAIHREVPLGPFPIAGGGDARLAKYVFNIWLDFSAFEPGRRTVKVRCVDAGGAVYAFTDAAAVAPPIDRGEDRSDGEIALREPDPAELARAIRALPSVVRRPERAILPEPPRAVLALRTDQLGDMVASLPALRRLRALVPGARLVGLLTAANADLARTLGLFDEVIVIDFPDDPAERRRIMPLESQERLRARLAPYRFDLAIDLAQSDVSRPLLRLSGAKFLYGVGSGEWPWLDGEFALNTHDSRNGLDRVPHGAKTLALVDGLAALLDDGFAVVRRDDLDRARLARLGVADDAPYAVLHAGARIAFSRWPHFAELAACLLDRTDATVVLLTDGSAELPPRVVNDPRFVPVDRRLAFDDLDALVSFAAVLVGNDSGPKHLASLRGVPAVTLFTARINWREWAQEQGGFVISRRVPCAGCALFHDADECGQDFTCIRDIRVEEVFDATVAAGAFALRE